MYRFGETVGIAFQIKDDLLDYGDAAIGKPTGNDIKEKKITLPLLYTLNNCDTALRKKMLNIIKHHNTDKEIVDMIVAELIKAGGIKNAEEKTLSYRADDLKLMYAFHPSGS